MAAFTTIAAGIGLAATAGTTTMSFIQAGNQKKAQRQAERDADQAMQEARKKLEVNYYDTLSIQKEPYELEREALLSQGAQAIQAGVESERGAAATAGRVQMAMNEGQGGIRSAMGQELSALEKLSAQEDSRLRDVGTQLDLEEVAGAQLAAANAQELSAQSMQQGMQGVTSLTQQLGETFVPLYEKSQSAKEFGKMQSDYASAAKNKTLDPKYMQNGVAMPFQQAVQTMGGGTGVDYGFNVSGVGAMLNDPFRSYMTSQTSQGLRRMRKAGFSK
jgi:vacuolar-type H+-ATPase subunit H